MKILFTGASSFTGFWFVRELTRAGHEVVAICRKTAEEYPDDLRRVRARQLGEVCKRIHACSFGDEKFLELIGEGGWDLLCHHAADVTNYKSADFDAPAAIRNNTHNLCAVLAGWRGRGFKSVVLTGTYFEAGEGAGSEPLRTFSPYSLSKTLTFDSFHTGCHAAGVTLGKFVIPNPFGPFEEPRFTAFLMKNWKAGKPTEVKTPDYLRDNIHADLLADAYAKFAEKTATAGEPLLKTNPSGYVEKQGEFAQRVAREVKSRLGWNCELKLAKQEDFSEPLNRHNTESAAAIAPGWNESKAWDAFAQFYAE